MVKAFATQARRAVFEPTENARWVRHVACDSGFGRWELGLLRPHQKILGLTERPWLKELMGKAVKKIKTPYTPAHTCTFTHNSSTHMCIPYIKTFKKFRLTIIEKMKFYFLTT